MTTFTRGGRNGKPSRLTKGLLDNSMQYVKNTLLGLGLLAMVSGCTGMGAVMSTSNDPRTRFVGNLMYHESAHQDRMKEARAGRSEVNVNTSGATYNSEERAILNQVSKMPRVVCIGDVDNDGIREWVYYDGEGNRYWVSRIFKNEKNTYSTEQNKEFFKREFHYLKDGKTKMVSPNTLVIWYQD